MNRATRKLKTLAEHLLGQDASATEGPGTAAFRACERFRHTLSSLLGGAGYRALLGRALLLATAKAPELAGLQVSADGSLIGAIAVEPRSGSGLVADSEVVLIAHFLDLLVTFIGEALTLRLVQDAWPKASLDDLEVDKGQTK